MVHRFILCWNGTVGIYCSNFGGQSGYITSLLFAASGTLAACITRNVLIKITCMYSMTETKLLSGRTRYNEKVHRNMK